MRVQTGHYDRPYMKFLPSMVGTAGSISRGRLRMRKGICLRWPCGKMKMWSGVEWSLLITKPWVNESV